MVAEAFCTKRSVMVEVPKVDVPAVRVEKSPYVAAKKVVKKFVVVALTEKKFDEVAFVVEALTAKRLVVEAFVERRLPTYAEPMYAPVAERLVVDALKRVAY